ncbi:MAG TPA: diaminopimelate epimerase [Candidatus Acidoferrales bacterium]|nr:diaminopimelate epimerase [Candidatus Acidoferrales bacterium]
MKVPFTKASACGNDFLIIEAQYAPTDIHGFTRRVCDRHNGIGADGVEWLMAARDLDARIRLINADGSEAEISGNGTRCVAAYLAANSGSRHLKIATDAGLKHCELISHSGVTFEFETEMGRAEVGEPFTIITGNGEMKGTPVSTGNPHYVTFVENFPPAWQAKAVEIQKDAAFKAGVNVEFVRMKDASTIEVRFFERGAGETLSSGTGSCASAAAAIAAGLVKSPVTVDAQGGSQTVRLQEGKVFLRGPAQLICYGTLFA